jgi:hypothetical protein
MGFASPGSFAWAALALVVAALYLWHFARRRHEVATFPLWQRALARRPAWFILRFWLSLIAQIAIVLLIVLALAEPFWTKIAASRRSIVLVLDVSASMSATDVQPSRFEQMRSEARRMIDNLSREEQAAILTAGTVIRTPCRLGASHEALVAAIDALEPTDGVTRIGEAVEVARDLLRDRPNPHVVVLTDGAFPQARAIGQQEGVRMVLIGGDAHNAAITNLAARPQQSEQLAMDVAVEVANLGNAPISTTLTIDQAGGGPTSVPLELEPGATFVHKLTIAADRDGVLLAAIEADDHLAADNRAALRVAGRRSTRVVLVAVASPVADALQQALGAMAWTTSELEEQLPDEFDPEAIYVLHRQVPSQIPAGRLLLLDPQASSDLWEVDGSLVGADCTVAITDSGSGLLSGVDLRGVVFERASHLAFHAPVQAVATAASGNPIYTLLNHSEGFVLVFHAALDRDNSDFLLRPDFGRLVQNAVRWLARTGEQPSQADRESGHFAARQFTTASVRTAFYATTADVFQLDAGQSIRRPSTAGAAAKRMPDGPLVALEHVGSWELATGDSSSEVIEIPVNLMNRAESAAVPIESLTRAELSLAEPVSDQPLWVLLAGLAILLSSLEWCLYHRRVVV